MTIESGNMLSMIPPELPVELIQILVAGEGVRIERIVSRGHCSAEGFWYDQDQDEFVLLIQGEAELWLQQPDEQIWLRRGDYLLIPAQRKHRVNWTSSEPECVWLTVFYAPDARRKEG